MSCYPHPLLSSLLALSIGPLLTPTRACPSFSAVLFISTKAHSSLPRRKTQLSIPPPSLHPSAQTAVILSRPPLRLRPCAPASRRLLPPISQISAHLAWKHLIHKPIQLGSQPYKLHPFLKPPPLFIHFIAIAAGIAIIRLFPFPSWVCAGAGVGSLFSHAPAVSGRRSIIARQANSSAVGFSEEAGETEGQNPNPAAIR